jgi:MoxR-like ATPase
MATQNPVEQEGTYPLPEAQLDRFLMKLVVDYPEEEEYREILARTTGSKEAQLEPVSNGAEIIGLRQTVRDVPVPEAVTTHAIRLVMGTQPGREWSPALVDECVSLGASPRGAQALILCGKVKALLDGRYSVSNDDVRSAAPAVLRHRVMINFHGMAEGVTTDAIVQAVLDHVKPGA